MRQWARFRGLVLLAVSVGWGPTAAPAQVSTNIVRDGSLGDPTLPLEIGDPEADRVFEIREEHGRRVGSNLFQRFRLFDLGTGDTALFTADPAFPTLNVVAGVTGGLPSFIDGTIASDIQGAALYFLNPSGVMFGPGSSLDVKGSFHLSSADYLAFPNGERFEAAAGGAIPSLVSSPTAFGFLGTPLEISIDAALIRVPAGRILSLVGGDLRIEGATLEAREGRIQLASVASAGEVAVDVAATDLDVFESLGRVEITQDALLTTSGAGGGLSTGCEGRGCDTGIGQEEPNPGRGGGRGGGDVDEQLAIRADRITVEGGRLVGADLRLESGSVSLDGALVSGADVAVHADRVTVTGGTKVESRIELGSTPHLSIVANDSIAVSGSGPLAGEERPSTIVSLGAGGTRAGDIALSAPDLLLEGAILGSPSGAPSATSGTVLVSGARVIVTGGAQINSSAIGEAPAGDIGVRATESITVSGSGVLFPGEGVVETVIGSAALGAGNGGEVTLEAPRVAIDGGLVAVSTEGDGDAGSVRVIADRVSITGGGAIDSSTLAGAGRGGDVTVTASESIEVSGVGFQAEGDVPSSIRSIGVSPTSGGTGGITLEAPDVSLSDRAAIMTSTFGIGDSSDVEVRAEHLTLAGNSFIDSSTFAGGGGGDLILRVGHLRMSDAFISASSFGSLDQVPTGPGAAGNIVIGPSDLIKTDRVELSNSAIVAGTLDSSGGDITINLGELLLLEHGSGIEASGVQSDSGGNVRIGSPELGPTPQFIVLQDESAILARAATAGGPGGAIEVTAQSGLIASPDSVVDAANEVVINSPEVNTNETIQRPETAFVDPSSLLRPSCVAQSGQGSFTVARRRSLPVSPEGLLVAFDDFGAGDVAVAAAGAGGAEADLPPVAAAPADEEPPLQVAWAEGAVAFRGGRFEAAKTSWAQAAAGADTATRGAALRGLAQSQLALGEYADSIATLQESLDLAEAKGTPEDVAAAMGSLANSYLAVGEVDRAADLFGRAIGLAKQAKEAALAAQLLNNLGNLQASRADAEEALTSYRESARQAGNAGSSLVAAQAQANAARAALALGRIDEATELLQQADLAAAALPPSHAAAALRIHLARSYEALATASTAHATTAVLRAHAALTAAMRQAGTLGDERLRSLALGNLGALYAREDRIEEALYLTRRAARAAEAADAFDLLPRWFWLEGKLLWADGRAEAAVAAYRRAVELLEQARQETLARYGGDVDFRRALAPVYLDLVDVLLQGADRLTDPARAQALLREARATMEQLKGAELRDYFRNECVAELEAKQRPLETVSARTAVVYPILLPDRIELLVGTREAGLSRHAVSVDADRVRQTVLRFGQDLRLRTTRAYRRSAQTLYDWLVRPYAAKLAEAGIDTLVIVPDGVLRTIPLAALHDGKHFLIERYAVAVTPSLSLVDPKPLDLRRSRLLLAGLSEPREVAGIAFGELEFVPAELAEVRARYGGELLLNDDFQTRRIEQALDETPPSIVHLATHAVFTGDAASSFVVTADGAISIDELGEAVGRSRFAREPLELLLLSACETAAGDERAALGLAGVAVRAGARSAVGSLWSVSDQASYRLVVEFYRQLEDRSVSKAEALARAQRRLLAQREFEHPVYWASFLLISNWL